MADVFISYRREEHAKARRIAQKLERLGLSVWMDSAITSGTSFDREIENALQEARAILVLWSPSAVASDWVRNEATVARERGVLVSLMLAPCELPVAFRNNQYEPLFDPRFADDDPSWVKTIERIKDLVGRRDEIDKRSRRARIRSKRNRILLWIGVWPLGALAILVGMTFLLRETSVSIMGGNFYADSWERGYFSGSGTWEIENSAMAAPENFVEISCSFEDGYCTEARAEIWTNGRVLNVVQETRPIVSWTRDAITTLSRSPCLDFAMTISRASESVTALRTKRAGGGPDCAMFEDRQQHRLVDGAERSLQQTVAHGRTTLIYSSLLLLAWTLWVGLKVGGIARGSRR
jgi:hypothetical protein